MTMLLPRAHHLTCRPLSPTPTRSTFVTAMLPTTIPVMLSVMIDRFDRHAVALGDQTLIPNHAMTWVALRQVRASHNPFRLYQDEFSVSYAAATLSYGIPSVNFAWNDDQTIFPSRLRFIDRCVRGTGFRNISEEQSREWVVLKAMMADWNRVCRTRSIHGTDTYPPNCSFSTLNVDFRANMAVLPRPYLAYAWRDIPVLERLGIVSRRYIPKWSIHRFSATALVDAAAVAMLPSRLKPLALWWDISHCGRFLDCQTETLLFPLLDHATSK